MSTALAARTSQLPLLALSVKQNINARASQLVLMALDVPQETKLARTSSAVETILRSAGATNVTTRTSQIALNVLYRASPPAVKRNRAWTYDLDGHSFYVLDLGEQGTFLYDQVTNQWCNFSTQGFEPAWNFVNGCMWGNRIVGADSISDAIWEMIPTAVVDEDWRDIAHIVTGGIQTRNRTFVGCDAVRVTASIGLLDQVNGSQMLLRYSDDSEATWSDYFVVDLIHDDFDGEIAFRSLGSFMAPGRIFELSDSGGLIRIDGADAFLNGFDAEQPEGK